MAKAVSLNRGLAGLALLLLALGLWQLGGAAWVHGKAWLAQRLLDRAWAATQAGARQVKPWPWADTWPVARLRVPELEVDLFVLSGASGRTLAFGPALVPGTEGLDHTILSGHRDTHFAFLRHLQDDSRFELQDAAGTWRSYRVRGQQVLDVRHPVRARPAGAQALVTLVTCYPFDAIDPGGPLRYAVTAEGVLPAKTTETPLGKAAVDSTETGGLQEGAGLFDKAL